MNALIRVGTFAAVLVALTGGAAAVGAGVGPVASDTPDHADHRTDQPQTGIRRETEVVPGTPAGLQITEGGYALQLRQDAYRRPGVATLRFRILDEDGRPVTGFETVHGKQLHLIMVSRDLGSFQHLHPVMAEDGTWSADIALPAAGEYRAFTDFRPTGAAQALTLGADLSVHGAYRPRPLPEVTRTSTIGDYEVRVTGDLVPGRTSRLTLTVTRNGRPVTDLQPYLEAYGHLVVLRNGDLAYLHVHPVGAPGDGETKAGPEITFFAEVPSAGDFRLFLDFKHGGAVRTAAFTARAETGRRSPDTATASSSAGEATPHGEHAH